MIGEMVKLLTVECQRIDKKKNLDDHHLYPSE